MKLNRTSHPAAKAPERIVHIGIGAFAKAHQIWYTQQVDTKNDWGVVAFTGRSPEVAQLLTDQDGLYTLIERSADSDKFEIVDRIVRAEDATNTTEFTQTLSNPEIALVTLTITEAGYGFTRDGKLDFENPAPVISRLAFALDMRRRSCATPIAIVPCDNIPKNGELLREAIANVFTNFGIEAQEWLENNVSFVSTSVDRITPQTKEEDFAEVKSKTNWLDNSVTVTEPFTDWILSGEFPLGRPEWENAGARFVDEILPFEKRKLWLLNGAHSILAYIGLARGHVTVAEAIADDYCLALVQDFWEHAVVHLPQADLQLTAYREALLERFANPRIAHQLRQIAIDGSTKLAVRIAPVALAELEAGRAASVEATTLRAWLGHIRAGDFKDSQTEAIRIALAKSEADVISILEPKLCEYGDFIELITNKTTAIEGN